MWFYFSGDKILGLMTTYIVVLLQFSDGDKTPPWVDKWNGERNLSAEETTEAMRTEV